jgi:hypothetical protein
MVRLVPAASSDEATERRPSLGFLEKSGIGKAPNPPPSGGEAVTTHYLDHASKSNANLWLAGARLE